ncbi:hybrid sensor histidine kinase/response regulator [Burkholderia vietnamiensis]|nr:hpt domain protein [Burkholderia vietnamiensis LMG 10929]AOK13729.1 hybrid sensor histidine kinase/response regulator [Burkholderia vietnamiensis]KVM54587.1 hybrid sensor histidine kinase/response regulator [Burkholderia vietnamiensis]KVS04301.1 hybrid sensor histidine kinase/response regulator [Burkholderia vietnamiensis]
MGAAALTLFILFAFVLALIGFAREELNDERKAFQRNLGRVMDIARASETRVRIVATGIEAAWESAGSGDENDVRTFEAQGGRIVFPAGPGARGALVLRLSSIQRADGESEEHFLAVTKNTAGSSGNLVKTMNDAVDLRWGLGGYIVTPSASMVGINPLPDVLSPQAQRTIRDPLRLLSYYGTGLSNLAPWAIAQQGGARSLRWLPPAIDPLSGRSKFRVLALVKVNRRPSAVVAGEFSPERLLDRLVPGSFPGAYWVFDERTEPVTSTVSGRFGGGEIRHVVGGCRKSAPAPGDAAETYGDGNLLMCAPLGATGWTLVYSLPIQIVAARVARDITAPAIVTGLAIVLLWVFVFLFNRRILAPLFERSQRIFESEHLSRTLIETAPVGLALVNANSHGVLLESAHMQALERRIATAVGAGIGDVLNYHAPAAFEASRRGESPAFDFELNLPTEDGTMIDVAAKLAPSRYQGQPVVVAALTDVTSDRQLARQLAAAKQAADSANAAKSAFVASMSHEIRTPLNGILGHLELLERLPQAAPVAARVRIITSSSRALLGILDDILDFSKIEAGEMSFESIRFDAAELIREAIMMFMPLAQRKQLELKASIDPALPRYVIGDPGRIRQIFANLLGNAIKFTDRGHVSIDVGMGEGGAASRLVIRVTDTGIGIPSDRLARIFDAFEQVDVSVTRRFGGTGLGLALCKRMAEGMGGSIDVASEVGHGSVFTVMLPILPYIGAMPVHAVGSQATEVEPDTRGIHVLVVEDHEVNRELIREQLAALGYTSDIVENGLIALRHFNERHYDLVLTDLAMPVMDGYTLAACLHSQGARTPIIAITADVTATDSQRFREAGISGILLKPMSLASIDAAVRRYLMLAADPRAAAAIETVPGHAASVLSDESRTTLERLTAESLQSAEAAMAQGDRATISAQIHSIKGAFSMIHVGEVVDACSKLEALLAGDSNTASRDIEETLSDVKRRVSSALAATARSEEVGQLGDGSGNGE